MQQRVESAWTDSVAVPTQFFNQPKAIDGFFRCMMKDVKFNETGESVRYHELNQASVSERYESKRAGDPAIPL